MKPESSKTKWKCESVFWFEQAPLAQEVLDTGLIWKHPYYTPCTERKREKEVGKAQDFATIIESCRPQNKLGCSVKMCFRQPSWPVKEDIRRFPPTGHTLKRRHQLNRMCAVTPGHTVQVLCWCGCTKQHWLVSGVMLDSLLRCLATRVQKVRFK